MSTTRITWAIFLIAVVTALVVGLCMTRAAAAAGPELQGTPPTQDCTACHSDIAQQWQSSKHAMAFSDDAFKKTWAEGGNQKYCLTCHTTGYDANTDKYVQEGVACQACHKPAGTNAHPGGVMTVSDSAEVCGTCHTTTLHEWQKGGHGKANIACKSCHDMHSTTLRVTESGDLCSNCHKERNVQAKMPMDNTAQCANCHMYTLPDASKAEGKAATGHSFVMSADACQRCHKDNIHEAHKVNPTAPPQPGTDKLIAMPTSTPEVVPAVAKGSSSLAGIIGGIMGGLLVGFVAASSVIRRTK